MKINTLLFASIFLSLVSLNSCQQKLTVNVANQIEEATLYKGTFRNQVDQYALYEGGLNALDQLIKKRLEKIDLTKSFFAGDTAFIELTIEADGSIVGIGHLSPDLNQKAQEIENSYIAHLLMLPKWKPALKDGKPVRSWVVLPLVFS